MLTFLPPDVPANVEPHPGWRGAETLTPEARKPGEWLHLIVEVGWKKGGTRCVHAWEKFPGAPLVIATDVPAHDPPPSSLAKLTITHRVSGMAVITGEWYGLKVKPPAWATAVRIYEWMVRQPIEWATDADTVVRQVRQNDYVLKRIQDLNDQRAVYRTLEDVPELDYRPTRQVPEEVRAARRAKAAERTQWSPMTLTVQIVDSATRKPAIISLFGWETAPDAPLVINQPFETPERPSRQKKQRWSITHRASGSTVFAPAEPLTWAVIEAAYEWFRSMPVDWSERNTDKLVTQVNRVAQGAHGLRGLFSGIHSRFNAGLMPSEQDLADFSQALAKFE